MSNHIMVNLMLYRKQNAILTKNYRPDGMFNRDQARDLEMKTEILYLKFFQGETANI